MLWNIHLARLHDREEMILQMRRSLNTVQVSSTNACGLHQAQTLALVQKSFVTPELSANAQSMALVQAYTPRMA